MQRWFLLIMALSGITMAGLCQTPFMITDFPQSIYGNAIIYPSTCNSFFAFKNRVYFVLSDDSTGPHLWSTDGTWAATQAATNDSANTGEGSSLAYLDTGYFIFSGATAWCGGEVWKSDGTPVGCQLLTCIAADAQGSLGGFGGVYCGPNERNFFDLGGNLYFNSSGWVNSQGLSGLWELDNSANGATLHPWLDKFVFPCIQLGNILLGENNDLAHGNELWRTDGTSGGTYMVKDLTSGQASTFFGDIYEFDSTVYFFADTIGSSDPSMLFKTDGTAAGTVPIKQFQGNGLFYCTLGNYLYFVAPDSSGTQIWKTDGTQAGTTIVTNFPNTSLLYPVSLYTYNSKIYFGRNETDTLYVTDGNNPPVAIKDSVSPSDFCEANDKLYFSSGDLWVTDGTSAGTQQLTHIFHSSNTQYSPVANITQLNNSLLFSVEDATHGQQLWELYLNPSNSCNADFEISPDTGQGNYIGYNLSTGNHLNYLWDFGDSTVSTDSFPSHLYATPGIYNVCLTVYDGDSCSSTFCDSSFYVLPANPGPMTHLNILGQGTTGIYNVVGDTHLTIYPNPASDQITIGPANMNASVIRIYDTQGRVVSELKQALSSPINISNLSNGVYLIEAQVNNQLCRARWVKM